MSSRNDSLSLRGKSEHVRHDPSGWLVPWNPERAAALAASGAWPNLTMADCAERMVQRNPDRALVNDGGLALTAARLFGDARKLAKTLIDRGLSPGSRISYQLPNWHEAIVIDLAATMAGLVVNPLVAIYREAEISFMMNDCGSRLLFIPGEFRSYDYVAMAQRILPKLAEPAEIVVVRGDARGFTAYASLFTSGDPPMHLPQIDPNSIKLVLYTSGTTGRPKGVLHTHNTVGAMATQFMNHLRLGPQDATLVASPITHITGAIQACQFPWISGTRAVLMDVWNGRRAVELIKCHTITVANGAAPFVQDLIAAARESGERLPSLRCFAAGGSAIPEQLGRAAYEQFPNCALFRCYGATETPTATAGDPDRDQLRLNISTDGRPVGTEVKIVDPQSGADLPHGQVGEIVMLGPQTMLGYLREDDNADAFDSEGYFRSGDLGRFVEHDWLEISGRKKDIIIRAGENLSAKEIEDALLDHPSVATIAVVAKPSPRTGEAACAFIVTKPGMAITIPDIAAFLIERGFAKQKIPEHLALVESLPQTPSGKVQKHILRDRAKELP
jgi:acyl-CoA synthetase (AMP-forming)/AMP-acid ligase II